MAGTKYRNYIKHMLCSNEFTAHATCGNCGVVIDDSETLCDDCKKKEENK